MQFAYQTAGIARIGEQSGNHGETVRKRGVPVVVDVYRAGIDSAHEAGTAGCADGTLTVSTGKRHPPVHEPVQIRSPDVLVSQGRYRIEALLIGAYPQYIRSLFLRFQNVPLKTKLRKSLNIFTPGVNGTAVSGRQNPDSHILDP